MLIYGLIYRHWSSQFCSQNSDPPDSLPFSLVSIRMSLLIAPYNPSMKLGSGNGILAQKWKLNADNSTGFNSYTQQLCIDHAVVRDETAIKYPADEKLPTTPEAQVAQSVTFKTEVIEKLSDLTDNLNVRSMLDSTRAWLSLIDQWRFDRQGCQYRICQRYGKFHQFQQDQDEWS